LPVTNYQVLRFRQEKSRSMEQLQDEYKQFMQANSNSFKNL
jgi:hypothetical protein